MRKKPVQNTRVTLSEVLEQLALSWKKGREKPQLAVRRFAFMNLLTVLVNIKFLWRIFVNLLRIVVARSYL